VDGELSALAQARVTDALPLSVILNEHEPLSP
jgi:hypothetical protein